MLTLSHQQVEQLNSLPALVECDDACERLVGFLHAAGRNDHMQIPDTSIDQLEVLAHVPGGSSLAAILTKL